MSHEIVTELAELQERQAGLTDRLAQARAEKVAAQASIVDGDAKAPAKAASADQKIAALTAAVSTCTQQISSRQAAIVAIRRKEAEAATLAQIAELARKAQTTRDELHQTHVECCAVLSDLVDAVNALLADLTRQRSAALDVLEQSGLVPDLCAAFSRQRWTPEGSARETALHAGVRNLNNRLQQEHGTSLDAILTRYDTAAGGKQSEADTHHAFPSADELSKRVEALYQQTRQAALRAGVPASMVG
jgi:predicted nucleic acid-binding Zn ribbon protein